MRMIRACNLGLAFLLAAIGFLSSLPAQARDGAPSAGFAVGPQYDTNHVYVAPEDFDHFLSSLVATFGGSTTKQGVFTMTPTPSSTMSQFVRTPAGSLSVFGFKTPVPWPFGAERTGYLSSDMDPAVAATRKAGADVQVKTHAATSGASGAAAGG